MGKNYSGFVYLTWMKPLPIITCAVAFMLLHCNKTSHDTANIFFFGKTLQEIRPRLQGQWRNHYARHSDGGRVTFANCFMDFRLTGRDSLIITCDGSVTSRAEIIWLQREIPQSGGVAIYTFDAQPVNSGNIWPMAPEQIHDDTPVLLELNASNTRYFLTRKQ